MADSNESDYLSATTADAGAPRGKQNGGAMLRAAREGLGLSPEDLATRTRINVRHIVALEESRYDALPGKPYVLGFARSLAKALGLDEHAVAEAVRSDLAARAPAPETRVIHQFEVGDPAKTPSRLVNWLAGLLVIAVLCLGLVFWRSYYWPSAELPSLVGPKTEAAKPAPRATPAPAQPARPSGPVAFTAQEDRIWVKFYDASGKQLLQKLMAKGETYTLPGDVAEPRLWTGRPDALTITIGGQAVPRIAEKEGIVKDVPVSATALLARGDAAAAPTATPSAAASSAPRTRAPGYRMQRRRAEGTDTGTTQQVTPAPPVESPASVPAAPAG